MTSLVLRIFSPSKGNSDVEDWDAAGADPTIQPAVVVPNGGQAAAPADDSTLLLDSQ